MTQLKDLKPNKRNPRKISEKRLSMLKKSIEKFGDLSGFVYNRQTKQLISGHQRTKTIPPESQIKIEVKHDTPTRSMTVAEGYVLVDGERFKYREVDAPIEWETEALLAANAHGGEWDTDILKVNFADFPSIDLDLAGFAVKDLQALDIQIEPIRIHTPSFFQEQAEEETDEDYLKNNPGPDGFEAKERIPNNTVYEKKEPEAIPPVKDINPFEEVKENTEVAGRRIVLIIDCPTDEKKKELKEKLRPFVDESGCQFF